MRVLKRRDAGGALLIVTIILTLMVTFSAVLLAVPEAELMNSKNVVGREKSFQAADAGIRDALVWLQGNWSQASQSTGTLYAANANVYSKASGVTATAGPYFDVTFGDNRSSAGAPLVGYSYTITNLTGSAASTMYFKITSTGWAPGGATPRDDLLVSQTLPTPDKRSWNIVTKLQAVVQSSVPTGSIPGPAVFASPSGSTPPRFGTNNQGIINNTGNHLSNQLINGNDSAGVTDAVGMAIRNSSTTYDTQTGGVGGTGGSPSIVGGTFGGANSVDWAKIDTIVNNAAAAPNGNGVNSITYPATFGNQSSSGLFYIKIAPGTTVSTDLIKFTGTPGGVGGVLVVDVGGPGADANSLPVTFSGSGITGDSPGNHNFQGTIIFYQRTPVDLSNSNTLTFLTQSGNQSDQAQFNTVRIASALSGIVPPTFQFASYVVKR